MTFSGNICMHPISRTCQPHIALPESTILAITMVVELIHEVSHCTVSEIMLLPNPKYFPEPFTFRDLLFDVFGEPKFQSPKNVPINLYIIC
jgi:hypothetical protein